MQKNDQSQVVIQQLLHGYEDGHSLIASSVTLNSELKRTVGILSDMSGPSMQKGFEEYITGYPLTDIAMYAISKTWYASEMPRPGSVWTHTILISFGDLPKIVDASSILDCFARPNMENLGIKDYSSAIKIGVGTSKNKNSPPIQIQEESLVSILSALYENPDKSVIVKSQNSKFYESAILEIWLQQWPRLKRQFTFCTGAIYPRNLENRYFDLQVSPDRVERSFDVKSGFVLIDPSSILKSKSDDVWREVAARDILKPSSLREFLTQYGADVGSSRASFINLVNSFVHLQSDKVSQLDFLILNLSRLFPSESEAETLKGDLLQPRSNSFQDQFLPSFKEEEIILGLAMTDSFKSFNYEKLKFLERFLYLYHNSPTKSAFILNELLRSDINQWGEAIIKLVAENLTESEFRKFADLFDKKLAFALVTQNSKLIYSDFFWKNYQDDQRELFSILIRYNKSNDLDWIKLIDILFKSNSDVVFQLEDENAIDLTDHILNWANYYNKYDLNYSWQNLLRNKPIVVLSWLRSTNKLRENTVRLITNILNPNSKEVVKSGSRLWIKVMMDVEPIRKSEAFMAAAAFGLALSLNRPDSSYLELLSRSFEPVYRALKNDELNYIYWRPIEIHTKPRSWYSDWDKCKKLIDALFVKFPEIKWSRQQINTLFKSEDIRERVWERYRKT